MTPISHEALCRERWSTDSLWYSKLIGPEHGGAAIIEMRVMPLPSSDDQWLVTLSQGVPDDSRVEDDSILMSAGRFTSMESLNRLIDAMCGDDSGGAE